MIKNKLLKKNNSTYKENNKKIKLSVQFNLSRFSFCISKVSTSENIYFSEYVFQEKQATPELLLNKIEQVFKTDTHLQKDFSSLLVVHQNNLFTLVPNKYFSEDLIKNYLKLNVKILETDFMAHDKIKSIKAKNIYIPYVNINNYLFQNFGEFEYRHHITLLIEKLLSNPLRSSEEVAYINVSKSLFDIVILKNRELIFANTFTYDTKEDFIYYILFAFEQLKLPTENTKVYFLGAINLKSELYKIAFTYIRNIYFFKNRDTIFDYLNFSKHSN